MLIAWRLLRQTIPSSGQPNMAATALGTNDANAFKAGVMVEITIPSEKSGKWF